MKGSTFFPNLSAGNQFGSILLDGIKKYTGLEILERQVDFLESRVVIGRSICTVATYLERASCRLNDPALSKFLNTFLSSLPANNAFSASSRSTENHKKRAARRIDLVGEYYTSEDYAEAWRNGFHKALTEVRAAGTMAVHNVLNYKEDMKLPPLPAVVDLKVSIYFLSFIILKVSYITE